MIALTDGGAARARLLEVDFHVPERVLSNADLEAMVDTTDEWIRGRTGIGERRIVAAGEATSDLAEAAARKVLERAATDPATLDAVIVATCTPDHVFPATAPLVAARIGARQAACFDVNAACTGFVYGVAQAAALVQGGMARTVLLVGADVITRYVDWTDRATCVLFGDGAGAVLVSRAEHGDEAADGGAGGFLGFDLGADGDGGGLLIVPAGAGRMRPEHAGTPHDLCLNMSGREVFKFATRAMVDSPRRLLDRLGVSIDDVDLLVAHQANLRIIQHAAQRLGIPEDRVFNNLERYGNTVAASIPMAMAEARDAGRLRPGDLMLMVGFGGGLTWGSTLVRYEPAA